jgi:hypothetical protein
LIQNGNKFYAYHITSSTTQISDLVVVETIIGQQHYNSPGAPTGANAQGQMKFSPSGTKIGLAVTYQKIFEKTELKLH